MGLTPRQIVVRAQESAWLLLAAVERGGHIERFLDSYAREFNRPSRTAQPGRYREMVETIRRESVLEMVTQVEEEVPRLLGIRAAPVKKSRGRPTSRAQEKARQLVAERQRRDLFREEFFAALGNALDWDEDEFEEFFHDREVYRKLSVSEPLTKQKKSAAVVAGPFVDRCALLLDPSLLDSARRAAAKFRAQLRATTAGILKKVFVRRREN